MEILTINLTPTEYELAISYQDIYYEIFNKRISLEELFKTALFINHIKINQKTKQTASKQTTLKGGGLIG
jgi:hypothetical protein